VTERVAASFGTHSALSHVTPSASAEFAKKHFAFSEEMAGDGFVSLTHEEGSFNLVYLRLGLPTFKPAALAGQRADRD
jgi:hypothetical protein